MKNLFHLPYKIPFIQSIYIFFAPSFDCRCLHKSKSWSINKVYFLCMVRGNFNKIYFICKCLFAKNKVFFFYVYRNIKAEVYPWGPPHVRNLFQFGRVLQKEKNQTSPFTNQPPSQKKSGYAPFLRWMNSSKGNHVRIFEEVWTIF